MRWVTVRDLLEQDRGVGFSFWVSDTGCIEKEAALVPVGHNCGKGARRIRLTVHKLPSTKVWYLVLV